MRFIKESFLYTLGTGLGRGLPFLLLPVLTMQLTVEDYGKLSLATTITGLLAIVIGMNPNLFVFANFFKSDRATFSVKIFNILFVAMLTCLPVFVIYAFLADKLNSYHITFGIFLGMVIVGLNRAVAAMHLAIGQMERRPLSYFVFYLLMAISVGAVLAVLIAIDYFTWQSMIFIEAGVLILLNTLYLGHLAVSGWLTVKLDTVAIQEFVRFSAPLIGHAAALWVISFVDRVIIAELAGIAIVGVYSVAQTIALGLSLLHESIHRAWQPIFFKKMQSGDDGERRKIMRYTWAYFGVIIVSAIMYYLTARFVLGVFLPEEYMGVFVFLPFLIAGYSMLGAYRFVAGYFYHYENTRTLSIVTITCSVLHVVATVLLVLKFGAIGAAYAAVLTYFVLMITVAILVTIKYKIKWTSRSIRV